MVSSTSGFGARGLGRFVSLAALLVVLVLCLPARGKAETLRGVALVIGNSAYEHVAALPNPANDARAVENLFNDLGFETTLVSDRDARRLARDLDIFIEDAEGADVAVVYYAGHGIEAGGENFLVPVDADLSAREAADGKLVPISRFVEQLQTTVPVAILMLDACRDNPFPAGATVRLDAATAPVPIGEGGLGETRGARRLNAPQDGVETFGTVIAFAAEPGRAALDGEPGGNSPYTQAVLRHFDAMAGEEFGTVMRMVAEEVYLKTSGRQRPWVNENLRRLLYLGAAPAAPSGEEGELLSERRQLLVTIASLPDPEQRRGQVERIAAERGIPLDAVYGMLRALGAEAPQDPAELEKVLRTETERFAKILAEREAVNSPDPEIVRLSGLADRAESEGLLETADMLRERAKARYLETEVTLEQQEAALRQRFIEGAAVFARSAETKILAFDHLAAARDYGEAFRRAEGRADELALRFKVLEMDALTKHGDHKGDNAALEDVIASGKQALGLADRLGDGFGRVLVQDNIATALSILGMREGNAARTEEALAVYHEILREMRREEHPQEWAMTHNKIGNMLWDLGVREEGIDGLEEAAESYRLALEVFTRERYPYDWALAQVNLANVLSFTGDRTREVALVKQAVEGYRLSLEELTRESHPLMWAMVQNNLGMALRFIAEQEQSAARAQEALAAFRASLEESPRERVPLEWAKLQWNIASALLVAAIYGGDMTLVDQAVDAYRASLEERTRERVPLVWATTQFSLATTLSVLGQMRGDAGLLGEAVEAFRASLEERSPARTPGDWPATQEGLARTLRTLGEMKGDTALLEQAIDAFSVLLAERPRERMPLAWAATQTDIGDTLIQLGAQSRDETAITEGRQALSDAWDAYREAGQSQHDDFLRQRIDFAEEALATLR